MICCFFGHSDTPDKMKPILKCKIEELILSRNIDRFYVGNTGNFDIMTASILNELKEKYEIKFDIILAYMPSGLNSDDYSNALYPDGIESVPKRFAISWRNKWMVDNSDIVICYINKKPSKAAKYVELACKKGLKIINLVDFI